MYREIAFLAGQLNFRDYTKRQFCPTVRSLVWKLFCAKLEVKSDKYFVLTCNFSTLNNFARFGLAHGRFPGHLIVPA